MRPKSRTPRAHRPFRRLRELVDAGEVRLAPDTDKLVEPPRRVDGSLSDEDAFLEAMREVRPLGWSDAPLRLPAPVELRDGGDDENEALARLEAFVGGRGEIDPFATGEGVEGFTSARARAYLGRLKHGDFSVQAHLDLHGMNLLEAKERLRNFIRRAIQEGHSCVRVVHGRGKHSPTEPAALKTEVARWLASRQMSRYVVAFASARWHDGGSGAVYVLLYRNVGRPRR